MLSERDLNKLDDYIANRLPAEERRIFENTLQASPELQREYDTQKSIADALRKARTKELKQMLERVPVPQAGLQFSPAAWWAAGLLVVGGTAGIYWYQSAGDAEDRPKTAPVAISEIPSVAKDTMEIATPAATEKSAESVPAEAKPRTSSAGKKKTPSPAGSRPQVEVFIPESETQDQPVTDDAAQPTSTSESRSEKPTVTTEVISTDRKLNFHYQLTGDRLQLYGRFDNGMYEILEFFSGTRRTVFLFYNNGYYLLTEEPGKVRPLVPVNDPALLQKLREYRSR